MNPHLDDDCDTETMKQSSQPSLLANSFGEQTLKSQLDFLRASLLSALEIVDSMRASYFPVSERELQLHEAVQSFEASLLRAALLRSRGNRTVAARLLGVKVTTFHAKLKRHKILDEGSITADPCPSSEVIPQN